MFIAGAMVVVQPMRNGAACPVSGGSSAVTARHPLCARSSPIEAGTTASGELDLNARVVERARIERSVRMDNAVALVRAYLQLNGYFTITEYPIVRRVEGGSYRTLTEIDVAALHLPGGAPDFAPDPALHVPGDRPDMILGEVKEGRAMINESLTDPAIVAKVLRRFGCCGEDDARHVARVLLSNGVADTRAGHRVRLVAFGATRDLAGPFLPVMLSDVVAYVDRYISQNWDVVRAAGSKDPVFGVMVLLAKARAGTR
jgi:hypothetical protein